MLLPLIVFFSLQRYVMSGLLAGSVKGYQRRFQMSDAPLFQDMDEKERLYSPESFPDANLPPEEVDADGVAVTEHSDGLNPIVAAPIANMGPSSQAPAPPINLEPDDGVGTPGDPNAVTGYPIGDDDDLEARRRTR